VVLGGVPGGVQRGGVLGGVLELEPEVQQPEVQVQLGTLAATGRARRRRHAGRRARAGSVPLTQLRPGAAAAAGSLAPPLPRSQRVSRIVGAPSHGISTGR
jgi:hypothetical protein